MPAVYGTNKGDGDQVQQKKPGSVHAVHYLSDALTVFGFILLFIWHMGHTVFAPWRAAWQHGISSTNVDYMLGPVNGKGGNQYDIMKD